MSPIIIALLVALSHGATAVQLPPPEQVGFAEDDYSAIDRSVAAIIEWEGPLCGPFWDEPCYVIVLDNGTVDVGP